MKPASTGVVLPGRLATSREPPNSPTVERTLTPCRDLVRGLVHGGFVDGLAWGHEGDGPAAARRFLRFRRGDCGHGSKPVAFSFIACETEATECLREWIHLSTEAESLPAILAEVKLVAGRRGF